MKVTEFFDRATEPLISYEIIPPKRGGSFRQLLALVDELVRFEPPFIDVTSHSAEVFYEEMQDGVVRRVVKRKRPGSLGICAAIKFRYGIESVPHLLCEGFSREETEDALIELHYLGIQNVLALRGDDKGYRKPITSDRSTNKYASDLVAQINDMNRGHYIDDLVDAVPTDFCIGVAGYPEKHFEAPNLQWDIQNLKKKVDAGADYIVTQMFFDNAYFFNFVEQCREAGITVPIVPGLKILTNKRQLTTLPRVFFTEIPSDLAGEIQAAKPEHVPEIGIEWAIRQSEELMQANVPSVHFYILQASRHVVKVVEALRKMA